MSASLNFWFLSHHDPQLVRLGTLAERFFHDDPNTCLIKLRQFGELMAQLTAANIGLYSYPDEKQVDLLRRLGDRGVVRGDIDTFFYSLRKSGNRAVHSLASDQRLALKNLKYAYELSLWFHRTFGNDLGFKPRPFVPPPNPAHKNKEIEAEIQRLKDALKQSVSDVEAAKAEAEAEAQLRLVAEELAEEAEALSQEFKTRLETLQQQAEKAPRQQIQNTIAQAQKAEGLIVLDEVETRRLIDDQLAAAGWEVDSESLSYQKGVRPQKGKNLAIAEYQTSSGPADYVLFSGLRPLATVEAKRWRTDVSEDALNQAKRYSRDYVIRGDERLEVGPWGEYKIPFVFATNGRDFLEQIKTKSGIWFCDVRQSNNLRRPIRSWYSPQDLSALLDQDIEKATQQLAHEEIQYDLDLYPHQVKAIQAIETALVKKANDPSDQAGPLSLLVAMATGTGKTRTAIALIYRLLKTQRFRRVLFLVDRTALGIQTQDAFKDAKMERLQAFTDIFELKELKDAVPDKDTRVHVATVQAFVKRILYAKDETTVPTAGQYDCIIVDECHRGYLLDRELSESELTFRDFKDYVSKYRRVLDHFDAVKIGLTATPALHTSQIFGEPVFTYGYREAVIDGKLIDHEPPFQIVTALAEDGMVWEAGEDLEYYDPETGEIDLVHAPDQVKVEVEQFNKKVVTEPFNRVVCEELAQYIDPSLPGKTLIFCVTDDHANIVVQAMREALGEMYGAIDDDAVKKITGKADKPLELIRKFKNETYPKIAVTVDLLTTGVDVRSITNLVFIRRVNSRILYEQMVGRATRLCPEIGKEVFQIFDAVGLYDAIAPMSTMKPVVVNPKISFDQLVKDLDQVSEPSAVDEVLNQLFAKIQRKRQHLSSSAQEQIEQMAQMAVEDIVPSLKQMSSEDAAQWFKDRAAIAQLLDRKDGGGTKPVLISYHEDEVRRVERGYGVASESGETYDRPEDYLDGFKRFLEENKNEIAALMVVTQRPRSLTRAQLKELRLKLDLAGFSEAALKTAWRDQTNEEIAASIIGFIRQAALGDPLMSYSDRVDQAMKKVMAGQTWTPPQRQWLERIAKQLKAEIIVDKASMDQGAFKTQGGGFKRLDRIFKGKLEKILSDIQEQLWNQVS